MSDHHNHPNRKAQIVRLRKVIGQLKAVERMIEEEKPCTDVLTQLLASKKAVQSLSENILEEHLVNCIACADPEDAQKSMSELITVMKRFVK